MIAAVPSPFSFPFSLFANKYCNGWSFLTSRISVITFHPHDAATKNSSENLSPPKTKIRICFISLFLERHTRTYYISYCGPCQEEIYSLDIFFTNAFYGTDSTAKVRFVALSEKILIYVTDVGREREGSLRVYFCAVYYCAVRSRRSPGKALEGR